MRPRNRLLAVTAGTLLALAVAAMAFAYAGQTLKTITVTGPGGTLKCGVPFTVTATLLATDGTPFAGEPVTWTFSVTPSGADKIDPSSTITDSSAVATTTVTLACVDGDRRITATSDGVSGSAVLSLAAIGLPRTSTLPAAPAGDPAIETLLALIAVLAGGVIMVRRIVSSPR
jgi:hypothetical protein